MPIDRLRGARAAPADGPLVTAGIVRGQRVVVACSVEATAAGVTPGQPLAEARVRVAGLAVAEAAPATDAALLRRIGWLAARCWTPLAMVDDDDALLLDITASAHLFGGEAALLRRMAHAAARLGLAVRGAAAGSAGAARGIARYGRRPLMVVPPGDEMRVAATLPTAALRLPAGVVAGLARMGFETVATLLAAPRAPLKRRFGDIVDRRLAELTGERAVPIVAIVPPEPAVASRQLLEPIATAEAIAIVIRDLADDLCATLTTRGEGVRRAVLACRRVDARDQTVAVGLARASRDPRHLAELLVRQVDRIDPGFGIEAMTLTADRAQPSPAEQVSIRHSCEGRRDDNVVAFPGTEPLPPSPRPEPPPEPDLAALVDRLANRFGGRAVHRFAAAESDAPTRSVTRLAALAPPTGTGWRADWPRPPRLLPRAEAALVTAMLPDHGPAAFTWRGRRYVVARSDGPERLFGEWWRGGARMRTRDYFQVEVADGGRYWLFRRGDGRDADTGPGDWYVHGAFG